MAFAAMTVANLLSMDRRIRSSKIRDKVNLKINRGNK